MTKYNISQLADDLQMSRETIRKRLKKSGLYKKGESYYLHEVISHLIDPPANESLEEKLEGWNTPFDLNTYYQAQNEKLKLKLAAGELVQAEEVERELSFLLSRFVQFKKDCLIHLERIGTAETIQAHDKFLEDWIKALSSELQHE